MMYRECPDCGAHLDPGERCDCHDEEKEDARAGTRTPSALGDEAPTAILSSTWPDVNDCLQLRQYCAHTGAQGKDIALVVREEFPKFNRQLLAQCQSPEKYGIMIHPEGLRVIGETYGIGPLEEEPRDESPAPCTAAPTVRRKKPNRKLPRKLTLRMTARDYAKLVVRVDRDGYESVQAWLYDKVMKMLEGENA